MPFILGVLTRALSYVLLPAAKRVGIAKMRILGSGAIRAVLRTHTPVALSRLAVTVSTAINSQTFRYITTAADAAAVLAYAAKIIVGGRANADSLSHGMVDQAMDPDYVLRLAQMADEFSRDPETAEAGYTWLNERLTGRSEEVAVSTLGLTSLLLGPHLDVLDHAGYTLQIPAEADTNFKENDPYENPEDLSSFASWLISLVLSSFFNPFKNPMTDVLSADDMSMSDPIHHGIVVARLSDTRTINNVARVAAINTAIGRIQHPQTVRALRLISEELEGVNS